MEVVVEPARSSSLGNAVTKAFDGADRLTAVVGSPAGSDKPVAAAPAASFAAGAVDGPDALTFYKVYLMGAVRAGGILGEEESVLREAFGASSSGSTWFTRCNRDSRTRSR